MAIMSYTKTACILSNTYILLLLLLTMNMNMVVSSSFCENSHRGSGHDRILDISVPLSSDLPTWHRPPGSLMPISVLATAGVHSSASSTSFMHFHSHTGTHVDAFKHFVPDNSQFCVSSSSSALSHRSCRDGDDLLALPLHILNGPVHIVNVPDDVKSISAKWLDRAIPSREMTPRRILFRTRHSRDRSMYNPVFQEDFIALDITGAKWVVERGVRLVGVDYLSALTLEDGVSGHQVLLGHGVVLVEGLDLLLEGEDLSDGGSASLICLPLAVTGGDGTPVRAALSFASPESDASCKV